MAKTYREGPRCAICEKHHYGRCPELVNRITKAPVVKVIVQEGIVARPEIAAAPVAADLRKASAGGFAPHGQCVWCDSRRAANAEAQRKIREKRKAAQ